MFKRCLLSIECCFSVNRGIILQVIQMTKALKEMIVIDKFCFFWVGGNRISALNVIVTYYKSNNYLH